jgi:hypothetical protein
MADKQRTQAHHRMLKDLGGGLIVRRVAAGHTGEVRVSFYGGGFRLDLERGRMSAVEHWSPTVGEGGNAAFPDLLATPPWLQPSSASGVIECSVRCAPNR